MLSRDAVEVAGVAPRAGVAEGVAAVHVVHADAEDAGVEVAEALRLGVTRVVDRRGHVDVDAADAIDQLLEALEVNDHVVVDLDPKQLLNGRFGQSRTPARVALRLAVDQRGVDALLKTAPGFRWNVDVQVTRHGDAARRLGGRVDGHDEHGVGSRQRSALARAAVEAHDQEVDPRPADLEVALVVDAGQPSQGAGRPELLAGEEYLVDLRRDDESGVEGARRQHQDSEDEKELVPELGARLRPGCGTPPRRP